MNPDQIIAKLKENHETFKSNTKAIRENWELSDAKKSQELKLAHEDAKGVYDRLAGQYREAIQHQLDERRRDIFAAPRVSSDGAMNTLVYRDALRLVKEAEDARDLSDLLELAAETGDKALARAALHRGYSMGAESIVHGYFKQHPDELDKWNQFMAAAEESNRLEQLGVDFSTGIPEPERPHEATYTGQRIPSYPPN